MENRTTSYRPMSERDRAILALQSDDFDSVQVTLSRFEPANGTIQRETLKTAFVSLEEARLHLQQDARIIPEPELTDAIAELERRGYDPMAFIGFVGDTAVRL